MTVEEFLVWDAPPPLLWQLVDGEPRAMAPASRIHAAIRGELGRLIGNVLAERGSPCSVLPNAGIIPHVKPGTNYRIPDLAVSCASNSTEKAALCDPILVIEILSPSNKSETWANVWTYTTIPSIREILVIESETVHAELLRRNADGTWPKEPTIIETGDVSLESIGFSFPIIAAYRTATLGGTP